MSRRKAVSKSTVHFEVEKVDDSDSDFSAFPSTPVIARPESGGLAFIMGCHLRSQGSITSRADPNRLATVIYTI